jgi:ABC-type lipoprotein release transport system permease subunit
MYFTYIRRELRRRLKQSIVVAAGLAIGIALVMTVSSAAAGVKDAQATVLHSLYGVGTDMTVTKTAAPGTGGPQHFGGFGNGRPAGGTAISRNTLRAAPGQSTLSANDVSEVVSLNGVAAASGGLVLTDTSFSGTIPSSSSSTGGGRPTGGSTSGGGSASFDISSFTVDGVQIGSSNVGPLTSSQLTAGSYFSSTDTSADVAIVSSTYATQQGLKVGSKLTVAGKSLAVIGIAQTSSGSADVFIPLATAQKLSGLTGDVTTIFVSATGASKVSTVAAEVQKALPAATVSTSADLAKEVTGALSSASTLANSLGRWLSVAALGAAFLVGGLMMMAGVSRRVREFGTLKAIGWRTRRIVEQVMGEGVALGILGGIAGIALGIAGAEVISIISPSLSATTGSSFATGGGGFGGFPGAGGRQALGAARTVLVHVTAPVQSTTILVALCLALAGGLVAGGFGAWRAARLRPAAALRSVE